MKSAFNLAILLILLVSCSNQAPFQDIASTPATTSSKLAQIPSSSVSSTSVISTSTAVVVIQPTPTSILYEVVLNDTLIGIKNKFNISMEALLAANPSIENQPLIIGQILTIPAPETSSAIATITPVPIQISNVNCFMNKDDSLSCLVLVKNEYAEWIQNLSIQISLTDKAGIVLDSIISYPPLDLLAPGKSTVVSSVFLTVPTGEYQTHATVISASTLTFPSDRYPHISLHNTLSEVNWDGLSAHVRGEVIIDPEASEASRVWILAIAYGMDGSVVGSRRWESNEILPPGEILPFELMVSSLGSEIDHVELCVEALR